MVGSLGDDDQALSGTELTPDIEPEREDCVGEDGLQEDVPTPRRRRLKAISIYYA